ncbi:MAG: pyrimidine 5'-nucleotidase [Anaerolineae bacterium]|nr:pyrimidine 5'-nucleotidase [Anaerolineae bacterium]
MINCILFDLDDTLYPRHAGVMDQIRDRMLAYLRGRLDISPDEADALRRHYFQTYGTTMRGLQINYQIDTEEYLDYVHNIPLHDYLTFNARLDAVLASIPQTKVVFTNSSREHATRVLALLGIRRHFERIIDIRDVGYESKPQATAYQLACDLLGVLPEECVMVDDNTRNLRPAKALGMTTVLVLDSINLSSENADGSADHVISCIEEIGKVMKDIHEQTPVSGSGS